MKRPNRPVQIRIYGYLQVDMHRWPNHRTQMVAFILTAPKVGIGGHHLPSMILHFPITGPEDHSRMVFARELRVLRAIYRQCRSDRAAR